jgi:hypothetical protein
LAASSSALLPDHDDFRAHPNPIGKINDILVGHPNAARRYGGPDGVRLVRPRLCDSAQAGKRQLQFGDLPLDI